MNDKLERKQLFFTNYTNSFTISENVALKKTTYQHGTYLGWNATRAVDGNPDQDGTYGSCAWAHNDEDVFKTWWNVDLDEHLYVHSLQIYFRTDGKKHDTLNWLSSQ